MITFINLSRSLNYLEFNQNFYQNITKTEFLKLGKFHHQMNKNENQKQINKRILSYFLVYINIVYDINLKEKKNK